MAFFNRVGKLLKQNLSKHVNSELSASKPSLFQAIRNMSSSSKLFVGGLSYSTDEMSLRDAFAKYGDVIEARVILDRDTGRSRGFGFVTFTSTEAASSAIQAFDGQDLHGRRIRVNYATERPRSGGFGGGYGTGGGYSYGDQGGNYGSGGYQGGSYGGSGGGNYPGGGGNFSRDGGFGGGNQYPSGGGGFDGGNQFPSGGGGFGRANNYPGGGGSSYGGNDVQDDGKYGGSGSGSGSGSRYSGSPSGFSSLLDEETTGTHGKIQEPPVVDSDDGINEDFGQDSMDKIDEDDNDEPNDYANTRS